MAHAQCDALHRGWGRNELGTPERLNAHFNATPGLLVACVVVHHLEPSGRCAIGAASRPITLVSLGETTHRVPPIKVALEASRCRFYPPNDLRDPARSVERCGLLNCNRLLRSDPTIERIVDVADIYSVSAGYVRWRSQAPQANVAGPGIARRQLAATTRAQPAGGRSSP